jgi:hypothetical protein
MGLCNARDTSKLSNPLGRSVNEGALAYALTLRARIIPGRAQIERILEFF